MNKKVDQFVQAHDLHGVDRIRTEWLTLPSANRFIIAILTAYLKVPAKSRGFEYANGMGLTEVN